MRSIWRPTCVAVLAAGALGCAATASRVTSQADWRVLFNGRDLEGWEQIGPGSFTVERGLLVSHGGMGLLWYGRETFCRVQLRAVYRLESAEADSGLFTRIPRRPADPWEAIDQGYEIEIGEWPDEYGRTGVVYSFSRALAHAAHPVGEWNTLLIELDGPRTVVHVNGVVITDYRDGQPAPPRSREHRDPAPGPRTDCGTIGLQNEPGGSVSFRELSVRLAH